MTGQCRARAECAVCGAVVQQHPVGRPRLYCSHDCKISAFYARHATTPQPGRWTAGTADRFLDDLNAAREAAEAHAT